MTSDDTHLREAIQIAREHMLARDGGPFGALIVRDGTVLARGWNRVTSVNDPTAHAEIVAIREACRHLGNFRLEGCVIFSSCEPCPMCLAAIYWARIDRMVFAATRDDAMGAGFDDEWLYRELALSLEARRLPTTQRLRSEAQNVFKEWLRLPDRTHY